MTRKSQGDLFAFACAFSTGLAITPAKAAIAVISSETLTFYLFVFAFGFSLFPLFIGSQRQVIRSVQREQMWLIVILALLYSCGIFFAWKALEYLEPATQSFLSRIKILLMIFLAIIILKEKLRTAEIVGGLIATVGVVLLKFKAGSTVSSGATLMIISALFFSGAEITLKKKIQNIHPTLFLFYRNLLMIPCFAIIIWLRGESFVLPNTKTAALVALTALLAPIIGRATYIMAIKRNSLSRTMLINQTQPIFAGLAGFVLLSSLPTTMELIGGGIILLGAFIIKSGGNK